MSSHAVAVTLDVDWAPDFILEAVAERLLHHRVRATWFMTHATPVIAQLRRHADLFEIGIHPNFLPGSTQGQTEDEVLATCMQIVPEATGMRTHCLVQSTPLLNRVMETTPIRWDVSLYVPHQPFLRAFDYRWKGQSMVRVPTIWEDDLEFDRPQPCFDVLPLALQEGVSVFDFHPVHVYLNSSRWADYDAVKRAAPRLAEATPDQLSPHISDGVGTSTAFEALLTHLGGAGGGLRVSDLEVAACG